MVSKFVIGKNHDCFKAQLQKDWSTCIQIKTFLSFSNQLMIKKTEATTSRKMHLQFVIIFKNNNFEIVIPKKNLKMKRKERDKGDSE